MMVSFWRIERSRCERMLVFPAFCVAVHDGGERKELGADAQACVISGARINRESDAAVLQSEFNRAASRGETAEIAHYKSVRALQCVENFGEAVFFRGADKDDLAVPGCGSVLFAVNHDGMILDGFSTQGVVDYRAERILSENANGEGRLRAGIDFRRPVDKFCEVVDEGGFELVFARALLRCLKGRRGRDHQESEQCEWRQTAEPVDPPRGVPRLGPGNPACCDRAVGVLVARNG